MTRVMFCAFSSSTAFWTATTGSLNSVPSPAPLLVPLIQVLVNFLYDYWKADRRTFGIGSDDADKA
jgi:hypothetical protein